MPYTPPGVPFVDSSNPVGVGTGQALNAGFFTALVDGVEDADNRIGAIETGSASGQRLVVDASAAPYNADPTGVADASPGLTAAIEAVRDAGGGRVQLRRGVYRCQSTVPLYSDVVLAGAGRNSTMLKLWNDVNTDLLKTDQFDTLTGGNTAGGVQRVSIYDLTLDGNKQSQTAGAGACLKHYGAMLIMERVTVRYARGDGIQSEWSNSNVNEDGCEGHLRSVVTHHNDGNGISWAGPHDSMWTDCISFQNGAAGYWIRNGAAIHVAQQCHSWGVLQTYAWKVEAATFLNGCQGEGASVAQLLIGANDCQVVGGKYFGFQATDKGILIGDATHTNITGTRLDTMIQGCQGGHLDLTYSGGAGFINANIYGAGIGAIGNPRTNEVSIVNKGGGATGFSGVTVPSAASFYGGINAIRAVGNNDKFNVNGTSGRIELVNGSDLICYSDNYVTATARIFGATGAIKVGAAGTGSRPSAAAVGAGGMFYDTTLGKPIWSNGTAWRDATGTAV